MSPGRRLWVLVPGDIHTLTGGYRYDRRILAELPRLGWQVEHRALDAGFPEPSPAALERTGRLLDAIPAGEPVVIDGLAFGAMPELAEAHGGRLRLAALIHHPLAEESGLGTERAKRLRAGETRALAQVRLALVTSRATARLLGEYGVPPECVRVAEPGTDPAPRAPGSDGGVLRLLCVGSLTHRKGHDVLLQALAPLRGLPWRLTCVGSLDRDPAWAAAVIQQRDALGLKDQVQITGPLDEAALARHYQGADLFLLATRFEGYGMVFAEALAHGLPILATVTGAAPDTVPPGAGILVPPGDPTALGRAARRVLEQPALRRRLAAGALAAGQRLPTWRDSARAFSAALEGLTHG